MTTLAIGPFDILIWTVTIVGMAAIGVVVWRRLQKQEARDPEFLKRLDDDDRRAAGGG